MSLYTAVSLGSSTANSTWNRFIIFTITFPPKPVGLRVFSKNDILPACRKRCAHPLAPSARVTPHSVGRCREATEGPGPEGLRPQAVGERTVRLPEIFRAMARFSPSAPSGHLPRRGRFFDTLSFPQRGSQYNKKPPLPGKRSGGFALAYTRPTYLLYHFYYVLFNPDYVQILHIKVVRSANRRNLRAVV